ncbi:hypothetical protein FOY51_11840 [Antrihabitans cavernicola]|uniref:Sensor domain-containing protein n=2 Tax=Antrihabitans cavernicola TaxID=2495913 RepID=A0A5A7SCB1_9NOCA|nr:hypothetical protein FOY51_11840 [Spelaeibacter cavernicola]
MACSSSPDKPTDAAPSAPLKPSVSAPATPSAPAITDSTKLAAALLAARDLPAGFNPIADPTQDPSAPSGPDADKPDKSHTDPAQCAAVLSPISDQQGGSAAHAVSRFTGPNFSSIDIDAASYPSTGAAGAFAHVQDLFGSCLSYSGTDADGIHVDYKLAGNDQPAAGDASVSIRATTTSEGLTLISDVVVAVVGSTVVQISATGQQPIDPKVLTDVTVKQVDRLRGAPGM